MKKLLHLTVIFILLFNSSKSQNIWTFGNKARINFETNGTTTTSTTSMNAGEGVACISDINGNLLFYTDGTEVWNRNNQPILSNIIRNTGALLLGSSQSAQSAVIVPRPSWPNQYFIFTVGNWTDETFKNGLRYGILDFTDPVNPFIQDPTINIPAFTSRVSFLWNLLTNDVCEQVAATCDGQGGYWVASHKFNNTDYVSFHIDNTGALNITPTVSSIGMNYVTPNGSNTNNRYGYLRFSPSGKQLCNTLGGWPKSSNESTAELLDFNQSSGKFSNVRVLQKYSDFPNVYCSEFSSDGTKLYLTGLITSIFQFDISNLSSGRKPVPGSNISSYNHYSVQRGPNGNIYVGNHDAPFLGCIENANLVVGNAGLKYIENKVQLNPGTSFTGGFPNFQSCAMGATTSIPTTTVCGCPNTNLLKNGNFELGNTAFTSTYTNSVTGLIPGQYKIINTSDLKSLCSNLNGACYILPEQKNGNNIMYVNGVTGGTGYKPIWSQQVQLESSTEYKLCFLASETNSCCFSVTPKIKITYFDGSKNVDIAPETIDNRGRCAFKILTFRINIPANVSTTFSSTINISIDESAIGDGNDLVIDEISLIKLDKFSGTLIVSATGITPLDANSFSMNASVIATPSLPVGHGIWWAVFEVDKNGIEVPGTRVENPNSTWWYINTTFPGYNGTSSISGNSPGIFNYNKRYKIWFGTWGDCFAWSAASYLIEVNPSTRKINLIKEAQTVKKPVNLKQ